MFIASHHIHIALLRSAMSIHAAGYKHLARTEQGKNKTTATERTKRQLQKEQKDSYKQHLTTLEYVGPASDRPCP
jgi:hypothetical protein